jgi:uncharacterized protein (TIGR02246 family)
MQLIATATLLWSLSLQADARRPPASATATGVAAPADAASVQALVTRLVGAANANDVKAFAAVFADDAEFTNVFGQPAMGRKAIEAFHAPFFSGRREPGLPSFVNAHLTVLESRIRFLRPDVAAVDIKWQQTGAIAPDGKPWGTRTGLMNWVVTQEQGVWAVAIMHNMDLPAKPVQRAR